MRFNSFFVFVDGNNYYCNNGNGTKILKKELKELKKRGVSEDDLKCIVYSYLTEPETNVTNNMNYGYIENEF